MRHHNQAFRQCADCYHWIGNNCRTAAAQDTSVDGVTTACRAFLRGSLAGLFRDIKPPPPSFASK